jgi:hypothetical protein
MPEVVDVDVAADEGVLVGRTGAMDAIDDDEHVRFRGGGVGPLGGTSELGLLVGLGIMSAASSFPAAASPALTLVTGRPFASSSTDHAWNPSCVAWYISSHARCCASYTHRKLQKHSEDRGQEMLRLRAPRSVRPRHPSHTEKHSRSHIGLIALTFSMRYTSAPSRRRRYAAVRPASPLPTTATRGGWCGGRSCGDATGDGTEDGGEG